MTNTEVVADNGNSRAVPSPDTLFSGYNDRVLYFGEGDNEGIRSISVLHGADEAWKLVENFVRRSLNVFVEWYKHRAVCLSPLVNSVVLLTKFSKYFVR
jgi:hypothetical protein